MQSNQEKERYPSTFTVDKFSSTLKLADNEIKVPIGSRQSVHVKDEPYNPYDHRDVKLPNSTTGALLHLLKGSLGSGILAMPMAFRHAGLLSGLIGTVVVGYICIHCVALLVQASYEVCRRLKKPSLGFAETAEAVFHFGPKQLRGFASTAKIIVDIALIVTYYMGNSVYVVFISESAQKLIKEFYPDADVSIQVCILCLGLPLMVMAQVRQLKYLVPFSFMANMLLVLSFSIILYYIFIDIKIEAMNEKKVELFNPIQDLPMFFSTVLFAMEGIGIVLPVENNMKHPQHFLGCPGVLNVGMGIVVVFYAATGFLGYITYGKDTEGSISYNLPVEQVLAKVVNFSIASAVFFTYSLQIYVPNDILWRKVVSPIVSPSYHWLGQIVLRICAVMVTIGVALSVPNLEPIIGLVGSICLSTLGLLIPAIVDTVLRYETGLGFMKWRLFKNTFLVGFSLFVLVSGLMISIRQFGKKE